MSKCTAFRFKIFADDTNVFASARDLKTLEHLMNSEPAKVKTWCDINKLSINMGKTNFMIIKSVRKKDMEISLNISNSDGSFHSLERKQCIKYLGVMLDESLTWKYHIAFVCSRLSRNIISKLRRYLSIQQLKQIYHNISYSILAWGTVHKTRIKKIQVKQNHIVRLIFYAKTFGRETESAKPLLNLLDILTVDNIYRLEVLKFSHLWHNDLLPEIFHDIFQYPRNMHRYNTRYTAKQNFYKYKVRTNTGKQSVSFMAIDIWKDIPSSLKDLRVFAFPKQIKRYLLSEQKLN